ncbi:hypothetical protein chiPu_0029786, partial [Chiloscyllium punctatum]|nr:hypothetical protein [Chiloscyllium punctatum]
PFPGNWTTAPGFLDRCLGPTPTGHEGSPLTEIRIVPRERERAHGEELSGEEIDLSGNPFPIEKASVQPREPCPWS